MQLADVLYESLLPFMSCKQLQLLRPLSCRAWGGPSNIDSTTINICEKEFPHLH